MGRHKQRKPRHHPRDDGDPPAEEWSGTSLTTRYDHAAGTPSTSAGAQNLRVVLRLTPTRRGRVLCQATARKTYAVIGAVTGPGPKRAVISSMTVARTEGPSPRSSTAARTGVPVRYPVARSAVDAARP